MRLQQHIVESINDKALMKAVFFVGYPGAGKTTIAKEIRDGSLPIMHISSDIWTEWFAKVKNRTEWADVGSAVKKHTISHIVNNMNGLLPVFVDTTGANMTNFKERVRVLEEMGYDTSLVVIEVSPETSAERVKDRNARIKRQVGDEFLIKAHKNIANSIPKFKAVIPNNITVNNDATPPPPEVILKAYRSAMKFFKQPVQNQKGKKLLDYMRKNGYKYYNEVPEDWRAENGYPVLNTNAMGWFKKL